MITIDNSIISLSQEDAGLASVKYRAELTVFCERSIEKIFVDSSEEVERLKAALKRDIQEVVYGDLINAIVNAYGVALGFSDKPEGYEHVKTAFEDVFNRLKISVPYSSG
jgi:hypothetical protein